MKMIGHQAKAKDSDWILGLRGGEQIEEGLVVPILMKDGRAAIATVNDMVSWTTDESTGCDGASYWKYLTSAYSHPVYRTFS